MVSGETHESKNGLDKYIQLSELSGLEVVGLVTEREGSSVVWVRAQSNRAVIMTAYRPMGSHRHRGPYQPGWYKYNAENSMGYRNG